MWVALEEITVSHLVQELERLKTLLLQMGGLVEHSVECSIRAVTQKDHSAAAEVLRHEARINAMEREVDDLAVGLLALYQPMAADLRLIVASLKINTDLERMGDLAENIARRATGLMDTPASQLVIDIPLIGNLVQSMVRKSLDAFVTRNADLARSVLASDDAVDNLRTACYHELTSFMEQDPRNIQEGLALRSITRNLERIADHSTNIAEDVLFLVKGIDVRHHAEVR
jgi:phosphate transport system protein